MRSTRSLLTLAAAVATGAACGGGVPPDDGPPRVALVLKTLNNSFFIDMEAGAREAASRLGVDLVVQAAEREIDVEKQMQIVENLIQTRVAALCITPSGSREIIPAIEKANRAGIPVVIVDTRVDPAAAAQAGVAIASFVGSDNREGGRLAGEHLVEITGGSARVAVLEGIPGHETADSRLQGFQEALAAAPGVTVVASQPANWERDLGFNVFQNILQANPDVDAVFAANDMMALGAVEAIAAAERTGQIRVIGFDAVADAREAIEAGTMTASVAQLPVEMGRRAVETAVAILAGEDVPAEQTVPIKLVTRSGSGAGSDGRP